MRTFDVRPASQRGKVRWKVKKYRNGTCGIAGTNGGSLCVLGPEDDHIHDLSLTWEQAQAVVSMLNKYQWEAVDTND